MPSFRQTKKWPWKSFAYSSSGHYSTSSTTHGLIKFHSIGKIIPVVFAFLKRKCTLNDCGVYTLLTILPLVSHIVISPPELHWGASRVTQGYLPSYTCVNLQRCETRDSIGLFARNFGVPVLQIYPDSVCFRRQEAAGHCVSRTAEWPTARSGRWGGGGEPCRPHTSSGDDQHPHRFVSLLRENSH